MKSTPRPLRSQTVIDPLRRSPRLTRAAQQAIAILVGSPMALTVTPRSATCRVGCAALRSTNCGSRARKNSATFGFRTSLRKACQRMVRLRRPATLSETPAEHVYHVGAGHEDESEGAQDEEQSR